MLTKTSVKHILMILSIFILEQGIVTGKLFREINFNDVMNLTRQTPNGTHRFSSEGNFFKYSR